jgi:hypothetical protein
LPTSSPVSSFARGLIAYAYLSVYGLSKEFLFFSSENVEGGSRTRSPKLRDEVDGDLFMHGSGESDYEPEPVVPLDYVEHVLKRF